MNSSKTYSHFCVGKKVTFDRISECVQPSKRECAGSLKTLKAGSLSPSLWLKWHNSIYTPHSDVCFADQHLDSLCFLFFPSRCTYAGDRISRWSGRRQHRGNLKNQVDTLERLYLEKAIVSHLSDIGRVSGSQMSMRFLYRKLILLI